MAFAKDANGTLYVVGQCADCRNGEHGDYDDDIELVYVRDPDTNRMVRRGKMCSQHREIYAADGYEVRKC